MNRLAITYSPDDDHHGEILAQVESGGFAGHGSAWFNLDQLKAFTNGLREYPLRAPLLLEGGFFDGDKVREAHVSIRIEPLGKLGQLQLTVLLADAKAALNNDDPKQQVTARFLAAYNDLARFQVDFSAMIAGEKWEAVLESSPR